MPRRYSQPAKNRRAGNFSRVPYQPAMIQSLSYGNAAGRDRPAEVRGQYIVSMDMCQS